MFMTIAHVESLEDLNFLVQELGEHNDEESMGIVEESDAEEDEDTAAFKRTTIHTLRSRENMQRWPSQL